MKRRLQYIRKATYAVVAQVLPWKGERDFSFLQKEFSFNRSEIFWSWIGAFLGIGTVGYVNSLFFAPADMIFLIGSFGASAVLIYGAISSPLAQPRNLVGGHLLSAIIGVTASNLFHDQVWFAAAFAVATAIAVMQMTKTLHPPGGATALIAVIGGESIQKLGYWYVITPVALGVLILLIIALVVNNIPKGRSYPHKK